MDVWIEEMHLPTWDDTRRRSPNFWCSPQLVSSFPSPHSLVVLLSSFPGETLGLCLGANRKVASILVPAILPAMKCIRASVPSSWRHVLPCLNSARSPSGDAMLVVRLRSAIFSRHLLGHLREEVYRSTDRVIERCIFMIF